MGYKVDDTKACFAIAIRSPVGRALLPFAVKRQCRQAVAKVLIRKSTHPPRRSNEIVGFISWQSALKMHFASIYMLQKALLKAVFGPMLAHFCLFYPLYVSQKARKLQGEPPKSGFLGAKPPPEVPKWGQNHHPQNWQMTPTLSNWRNYPHKLAKLLP